MPPFLNPTHPPDAAHLHKHLGAAGSYWDAVVDAVRSRAPKAEEVWRFASPTIGWSLRLVDAKRNLIYLTPGEQAFRIGLVLGKKIVAAARFRRCVRQPSDSTVGAVTGMPRMEYSRLSPT
jgi:hypothetical protein